MDVFTHAATQMAILFILIFLGAVARHYRFMNDRFSTMLSQLVMNITLPAMIVSSVLKSTELPDPQMIGSIVILSLASYALVCAFAFLVARVLFRRAAPAERGSHAFMIAFGNVGFMGLPVLGAIFGETAVLYGAIYNIAFNLAVLTVGIRMLHQGQGSCGEKPPLKVRLKGLAQSVANPCMTFSVVAIALALLGVTDNDGLVGKAFMYAGQMTVPASMFIIGCSLAKMSVKSMLGHVRPYVSSLLRLVVVPLLMFAVFRLFVSDPTMLGVVVICSGMPVASMGAMLSMIHGGDVTTMMRGTFISTVLSLVTIPLLALLVV